MADRVPVLWGVSCAVGLLGAVAVWWGLRKRGRTPLDALGAFAVMLAALCMMVVTSAVATRSVRGLLGVLALTGGAMAGWGWVALWSRRRLAAWLAVLFALASAGSSLGALGPPGPRHVRFLLWLGCVAGGLVGGFVTAVWVLAAPRARLDRLAERMGSTRSPRLSRPE
jgi:hypothetical protein